MPLGTYCWRCQIVSSYSRISGNKRARVSGFGVERSMWQRQIQIRDRSGALARKPAGWGSWTMITSQSSSRLWAFIAL